MRQVLPIYSVWSIVEVLFNSAWYYGVRHSFPPPLAAHVLLVLLLL